MLYFQWLNIKANESEVRAAKARLDIEMSDLKENLTKERNKREKIEKKLESKTTTFKLQSIKNKTLEGLFILITMTLDLKITQ